LTRSRFLTCVPVAAGVVVVHALRGTSLLLNAEAEALLDSFAHPPAPRHRRGYRASQLAPLLDAFLAKGFLLPADQNEREAFLRSRHPGDLASGAHLRGLSLVVSERCNLACPYCLRGAFLGLPPGQHPAQMSIRTARQAIRAFLRVADRHLGHNLQVSFRGGEPLLAPEVVFAAVRDLRSIWPDRPVRVSLVTNGTLVTDAAARQMAALGIAAEVSLDGPQAVHDALRLTRTGGRTHHAVRQGIDRLHRAGVEVMCVNATGTAETLPLLGEAFMDELAARGLTFLNLEPDVLRPAHPDPRRLAERILELRAVGRGRGVEVSGCWARPFGNLRRVSLGEPLPSGDIKGLVVGAGGAIIGSEYDGHQVLGPAPELRSVLASEQYRQHVESRLPGRIPECRGCEIEGLCQGGASVVAAYERAAGRTGLFAHRCAFVRAMTLSLIAECCLPPGR